MAVTETIQELLQGIDDAQYGRDMRQFIHKGIQKCYEEGSAGETDLTARNAIDNMGNSIATVETTTTASRAYAVGDYLLYEGQLYKVKRAISKNGTLVIGTNIEDITVADIMQKLDLFTETVRSTTTLSTYIKGKVIKYGHVCTLNIAWDTTKTKKYFAVNSDYVNVGMLPSGFRPSVNYDYATILTYQTQIFGTVVISHETDSTKNFNAYLFIDQDGNIRVWFGGKQINEENKYYLLYGFAVFLTD